MLFAIATLCPSYSSYQFTDSSLPDDEFDYTCTLGVPVSTSLAVIILRRAGLTRFDGGDALLSRDVSLHNGTGVGQGNEKGDRKAKCLRNVHDGTGRSS